jgi:hypothetical protein
MVRLFVEMDGPFIPRLKAGAVWPYSVMRLSKVDEETLKGLAQFIVASMGVALMVMDFQTQQRAAFAYVQSVATVRYFPLSADQTGRAGQMSDPWF